MLTFEEYKATKIPLASDLIGLDSKFFIVIKDTFHADERTTRHGTGKDDLIGKGEIITTCKKAYQKIFQCLIDNKLDLGADFVVYDKSSYLNVVCHIEKSQGRYEITVKTVMRKKEFLTHGLKIEVN